MHNVNDQVSSYEWNSVNLIYGYDYTLSYNVKSFQLLPSPFTTNCMDYAKETEFQSRKDCIRKCKVRQAVDKCGGVYTDMDVFEGEPNVTFVSGDRSNCVSDLKLNKVCPLQCPRYDCFKQHIEAFVLNEGPLNDPNGLTNKFELLTPFEPKTVYEHRPSIEIIEFLCHWGSTISLWFGVSIISVFFKMKKFITINLYNNYFITTQKSTKLAWTN